MKLLHILEKQNKYLLFLTGILVIGIIGILDYVTGSEFAFSLFYVIPIAYITWLTDKKIGLIACVISALVWLSADISTGNHYTHHFAIIWNTLIRLLFFVIISLLLSSLLDVLKREQELAHTDPLTGAMNSRRFYALAQMEVDRCRRYQHPFSLAYLDVDNFKNINDQFGHIKGDEVLCAIAQTAAKHLRETDTFARVGGDEFTILLPETGSGGARIVLEKLQGELSEQLAQNGYLITFSLGVLSCTVAPASVSDLIQMADRLMYSVKNHGKNSILFATYP